MPADSPEELRKELKAFERDLARLVAKFMGLYDRLERDIRPETKAAPPAPLLLRSFEPPTLPGYQ